VRFVRAGHWSANRDGNNRTGVLAQTVGTNGPVLFRRDLGDGDIVAAGTHEALIHVENNDANGLGMHFGDILPETDRTNQEIWTQLPNRLRPSGELWRRKLCVDNALPITCTP
jgi:hypothetical protein